MQVLLNVIIHSFYQTFHIFHYQKSFHFDISIKRKLFQQDVACDIICWCFCNQLLKEIYLLQVSDLSSDRSNPLKQVFKKLSDRSAPHSLKHFEQAGEKAGNPHAKYLSIT